MALRLEEVLARRLRELAAAKEIPLSHVADRAVIARSYFWRLLDGESSATLDVVQRLADAIEVDPLELLKPSESGAASVPQRKRAAAARAPHKRRIIKPKTSA